MLQAKIGVILAFIIVIIFGRHGIMGTFEVSRMRSLREHVVKSAEAGSYE